jgi:predicted phosphodiesterase
MPIKILATGDLHIGLSASGVPGNAGTFSARENWKRIVTWAVSNRVDVLALTGDIVDRDNCFFEAVGALQKGFRILAENKIEVFAVAGNHDFDVLPQVIRSGKFNNVHLLGAEGRWELYPFNKDRDRVNFIGWSFTRQYIKEDPLVSFSIQEMDTGIPSIGLLHGDAYAQGSKYAPVSTERLKNIRLDTWILGHIHKPDILNDAHPFICYPGSPMALSSKETGIHSPLLFNVSNNTIGKPERVIISPVRFENIAIDITGTADKEDFRLRLTEGIMEKTVSLVKEFPDTECLIFSVECSGNHRDPVLLDSWSEELTDNYELGTGGNTSVFVKGVSINVAPEIDDIRGLAEQKTPAGLLAGMIIALEEGSDDDRINQIINRWKEKFGKINHSETYLALAKSTGPDNDADSIARIYLLKESRRLLGELLKQKQE